MTKPHPRTTAALASHTPARERSGPCSWPFAAGIEPAEAGMKRFQGN